MIILDHVPLAGCFGLPMESTGQVERSHHLPCKRCVSSKYNSHWQTGIRKAELSLISDTQCPSSLKETPVCNHELRNEVARKILARHKREECDEESSMASVRKVTSSSDLWWSHASEPIIVHFISIKA